MISKVMKIISMFVIPNFIFLLKSIEQKENIFIMIWTLIFTISFIGLLFYLYDFKGKNREKILQRKEIKIIDSKYNLKIFEMWFLIISPCLVFDTIKITYFIGIFVLYFIIFRILYAQDIYVYNVILMAIGFKFYKVKYKKDQELILISKRNYSNLSIYLDNLEQVKVKNFNYSNIIYLK